MTTNPNPSSHGRKETNLIQCMIDTPYDANGIFGDLIDSECTPLVLIPKRRNFFKFRFVV